ncbi:MAG TPA: hypothetical protein VH478_23375 [Trebonia sp.]|jgi:hypothetical protein|nr:hypothetical protein [Trebonia sp.]
MNAMAVTRQAELYQCRVRLTAEPTAPGHARARVRQVIRDWDVPVDEDVAMLLTSDLVTHAIRADSGGSITLVIRCLAAKSGRPAERVPRLRIEVHDSSRSRLGSADAPSEGVAAEGVLAAVGSLSAEWGSYRTPAGLAWFFTLAFMPDLAVGADRDPQGNSRGDGEA